MLIGLFMSVLIIGCEEEQVIIQQQSDTSFC